MNEYIVLLQIKARKNVMALVVQKKPAHQAYPVKDFNQMQNLRNDLSLMTTFLLFRLKKMI